MVVTIKKGSHYSSGFSLSGVHMGRTSMSFRVTFDSNCLVLPGRSDCDGDTNKLFGWSYGWHHSNSIRVGWKARDGRIRLVAYMYENGTVRMKGFAWADVNQPINISVNYSVDTNYVTFDAGGTMYSTQWYGTNPTMGYNLKPYYGGNCPAPIDMTITME